jgi:hypothetical protein
MGQTKPPTTNPPIVAKPPIVGTTGGSTSSEVLITQQVGPLTATFRGGASPDRLSGVADLRHTAAPTLNPFRPTKAGLNWEHIISGNRTDCFKNYTTIPCNSMTPRYGPQWSPLAVQADGSVCMSRPASQEPWRIASTMCWKLSADGVDLTQTSTFTDVGLFAPYPYAVFFHNNYMDSGVEMPFYFYGQAGPGQSEMLLAANGSLQVTGAIYRHVNANELVWAANHDSPGNLNSEEWPRYTKAFYFWRAQSGMVFALLLAPPTVTIEPRLALFKPTKVIPNAPALDWEWVIHQPQNNVPYTLRSKILWFPMAGTVEEIGAYVAAQYAVWTR